MPHKRAKRSTRDLERKQHGSDAPPAAEARALSNESIPKSVARVLDAARVRADWRKRRAGDADGATDGAPPAKKRKRGDDGAARKGAEGMSIRPGESLSHFNRRVEDNMRPIVRSAMVASSAHARASKKAKSADDDTPAPASSSKPSSSKSTSKPVPATTSKSKHTTTDAAAPTPAASAPVRATEFATMSSAAPRRLNDIAQAPPTFARTPKERGIAGAQARLDPSGTQAKAKAKKAESVVSLAQRARMEEERERVVRRYREMKAAKMAKAAEGRDTDA